MTANGKPGTAVTLLEKFSAPLGLSPEYFKQVVKATVLKTKDRPATDEELAMFLAIADRYGLDVWTKQIHGFVDKGAIVPIVGVDGWNHLETHNPDGTVREDFAYEEVEIAPREEWVQVDKNAKICPEWVTVRIFHKASGKATVHTEYLDECYVPPRNGYNGPWQTHTKRMLRHKARIQCIREAFGFGGIYDEDEAQRIIEGGAADYESTAVEEETGEVIGQPEYDALLAEMERTQISLESIARNVAAKAGYQGELADMPLPVWESLMAGLATMQTHGSTPPDEEPTTATQRPVEGVATPSGSDEAQDGSSDAASEDAEVPGRGALTKTTDPVTPARQKLLDNAWNRAINEGADEGELLAAVCDAVGAPTLEGLTMGQAQAALTYLKAQS